MSAPGAGDSRQRVLTGPSSESGLRSRQSDHLTTPGSASSGAATSDSSSTVSLSCASAGVDRSARTRGEATRVVSSLKFGTQLAAAAPTNVAQAMPRTRNDERRAPTQNPQRAPRTGKMGNPSM